VLWRVAKMGCVSTLSRDCGCFAQYYCLHSTIQCIWQLLLQRGCASVILKSSQNEVCFDTISRLWLFRAVLLLAQHYTMHLTTVVTAWLCQCHKWTHCIATNMPVFCAWRVAKMGCVSTLSRDCDCFAQYYCLHSFIQCIWQLLLQRGCASVILKSSQNEVCFDTISRLWLFRAVLLLAQHYGMHFTTVITARLCQCHKWTHFIATNMSVFCALKSSQNGVCSYTISRLWLFRAVLLLAQHYTMHLITVITARLCQCHKWTDFIATNMPVFSALKSSQNGVCSYTISRLWLFQAVLLLAQHYSMHLTTVITARLCQCHKWTDFIATNMSVFVALKSSQNGVCSYTISRLWLFQAVLLLAQHYSMHFTTVITARLCQCHKWTHFIATNMSVFCALKSSQNGVCSYTISRLWLFRAVLLPAQHYSMHLTTVISARLCQCHKWTHFIATNMPVFSALKSSQNGVCFDTISRLWLFRAVLLLAQHYTMHLTIVITARLCQCHKWTDFIATNMPVFCALKSSQNGVCFDTFSRLWLFQAVLLLA
jgi:hypothetical protein